MFSRPSTPTTGRFRSRFSRRKWGAPVVLGGVAGLLLVMFLVSRVFSGGGDYDDLDSEPPPAKPDTQHDLPSPQSPDHPHYPSSGSDSDDDAIDALFARQSTTLEQAAGRYRLKNDRDPPQGYKAWFRFAQENKCLIDDYDQVYRDFAPFYQLAGRKHRDKHGDKYFGAMVEKAAGTIDELDMGLRTFTVRDHEVGTVDEWKSNYDDEWNGMLRNFSKALPNMKLIVNHRDEPRVAFDVRQLGAEDLALQPNDMMFFRNKPAPTSDFYFHDGHCRISNDPNGFLTYANTASSFLSYSASSDITTDLFPVLSQSKIYPCFADIVFPSPFHYPSSHWHPEYHWPDNVEWANKKSVLYWRGQSTGGWIYGDNYRSFPRFRLLDLARDPNHAPLMDVAITAFYEHFCQLEGCDADKIKAEYGITGENAPREDVYGYKYVLDLDGNAFSGRFLGLLKSGSLVFKSTLFTEYFDEWLRPFEHYVPVLPDLSDLVQRIEWARENDGEARRIQKAGKAFVERVLTDAQNDCYFYLVLLEWARLEAGGR